jgi:Ala-tRNA(Pro) deacylase
VNPLALVFHRLSSIAGSRIRGFGFRANDRAGAQRANAAKFQSHETTIARSTHCPAVPSVWLAAEEGALAAIVVGPATLVKRLSAVTANRPIAGTPGSLYLPPGQPIPRSNMDGSAKPADSLQLFACLDALGIHHETTRHPAAFTVEQGNAVWGDIPGVHCKNLFLKDAKSRLWLVVAPAEARVNLKTLAGKIGSARLSFGSPSLLAEVLGIQPGSVTPFALVNDPGHRVTVVLDSWMMAQPLLNYHPLTNEATTTISNEDFRRFLRHCGHEVLIVPVS